MTVRRFEPESPVCVCGRHSCICRSNMEEDPQGDYVLFEDYEKLATEVERLDQVLRKNHLEVLGLTGELEKLNCMLDTKVAKHLTGRMMR